MDNKMIKSAAVFIASAVSGFFMWMFWVPVVSGDIWLFTDYKVLLQMILLPLILTSLTFAIYGILGSIMRSKLLILAASFIAGLEMLYFFGFGKFIVLAFIVFLAFSYWYMNGIANESRVRIKFSFYKTATRGLASFLLFFFIVLSILFYSFTGVAKVNIEIPSGFSELSYKMASVFLRAQVKDYRDDMTINEFLILSIAEKSGSKSDEGDIDLVTFIEQNRNTNNTLNVDALIDRAPQDFKTDLDKARDELLTGLGIEGSTDGNMTMKEVIQKVTNEMLTNVLGSNKKYIGIISAVIFLLVLEIFNPLFYIITALVGLAIYGLLFATKFFSISVERRDTDQIEI